MPNYRKTILFKSMQPNFTQNTKIKIDRSTVLVHLFCNNKFVMQFSMKAFWIVHSEPQLHSYVYILYDGALLPHIFFLHNNVILMRYWVAITIYFLLITYYVIKYVLPITMAYYIFKIIAIATLREWGDYL